jgi:hypothetical protein
MGLRLSLEYATYKLWRLCGGKVLPYTLGSRAGGYMLGLNDCKTLPGTK